MNILFTRFPFESAFGGAEVQTLSLMRELLARGHTASFLGSCPVLLAEAPNIGVTATKLEIGPPPVTKGGAASFLWRRFAMQRALIQAMESLPAPDAVCMLSLSEKLLLTGWCAARGQKVLWIEHDGVGRWLRWNPWLPELKRAAANARVVCVSELSRRAYLDMGFRPEGVVSAPNGIDLARLSNAPPPSAPATGPLRVGCVARLAEDKGVDVLIHAMRDLPQATLDIVGVGPEEAYLRTLILELEAREHQQGRVRILGRTDDLPGFYRSLHVFVLPSTGNDPFGLVAGEAMALGVATVVTDRCGIASHLRAGTDALVVPAGSPKELAKAIASLASPAARKAVAEAGASRAAARFSISAMADAYENFLKE